MDRPRHPDHAPVPGKDESATLIMPRPTCSRACGPVEPLRANTQATGEPLTPVPTRAVSLATATQSPSASPLSPSDGARCLLPPLTGQGALEAALAPV